MPSYRYIGTKVYTRHLAPPEPPPPPGITVQAIQPGDVVDDLTDAEIQAFGDRFEVIGEEAPVHPQEAPAHEGRQTRARHE